MKLKKTVGSCLMWLQAWNSLETYLPVQRYYPRHFQVFIHLLCCCSAAWPSISVDSKGVANPCGARTKATKVIWTYTHLVRCKKLSSICEKFPALFGTSATALHFPSLSLSLFLSIWYISKTLVDLLAHGRHGRSYSVVLEVDHLVADEDSGLTS